MAANEAECRFKFQGLSGFFFNFTEEQAQQDSVIPATTLPGLGLVDKAYNTDDLIGSPLPQVKGEKTWQRFKAHVESLNAQDPSVTYKVLYLTRHGFGYHNAFMAQVGRDAWNVSISVVLFYLPSMTVARITGRTWTEMARSPGLIHISTTEALSR